MNVFGPLSLPDDGVGDAAALRDTPVDAASAGVDPKMLSKTLSTTLADAAGRGGAAVALLPLLLLLPAASTLGAFGALGALVGTAAHDGAGAARLPLPLAAVAASITASTIDGADVVAALAAAVIGACVGARVGASGAVLTPGGGGAAALVAVGACANMLEIGVSSSSSST